MPLLNAQIALRISLVGIAPMDAPNTELSFSFAGFTKEYDQHIEQSIRGYVDLLSDCIALSEYFVEDGTVVFDVGCSTGTFLREIWRKNRDRCPNTRYIGIDIEDKFCNYWHEPNNNCVNLLVADARTFQIPEKCSFVTSIFSLQFIPPRERQTIVDQIYSALVPGGALVVAEKTLSKLPRLNDMLTSLYYEIKRQSFTEAEILAKERSLRSIMKLWSEEELVNSMIASGFSATNLQCFWRNHHFAAFVALK